MKRTTARDALFFVLLVALGAGLRVLLRDLPNFAPVAALALFAGFYFANRLVAASVPLLVMLIADMFIGAYNWKMMLLVYGTLILPSVFGGLLRGELGGWLNSSRAGRAVVALLCCSLGASLLFFFATNFGAWIWFDSYPKTWSGLVACYTAALPFFRFTLAGDLLFAVVLFGGYGLALFAKKVPVATPPDAALR